ncbi:hypothetical protein TNIN_50051 [Trichonephila inaurata madagascariensis]|uniref:Uncharacterized protein n=1 Tax=Trichonephila inaurata madagascariensis TaxID=2747483 RepID=A0A8X6WTQ2_9ARAC|nr:hypothetical protein TNIN_50051 [Trichonephila inaurata madagascariensis]
MFGMGHLQKIIMTCRSRMIEKSSAYPPLKFPPFVWTGQRNSGGDPSVQASCVRPPVPHRMRLLGQRRIKTLILCSTVIFWGCG